MQNAEVERLLMKPTARQRLGRYLLLGRLGHGGMGKIYLAFSPGPGGIEKLLVIKRLHSHLTSDPVLVSNFLDEARLSMVLTHPNIVHTYDVGDVDGRYFIVMEYIDGQNLGVLLRTAKRSGKYPDGALWGGLFLGVLDALHAAHTAKDARGRELHIIHRDVSPQNVLVTYDGMPKLVDFGIAKAALRVSETDAGVLKGKYSYMSPEQCQSLPLDPRSDVFSAGIVLWEMLAGRRLYKADSVVKSVERILTEAPILPTRVNPGCDPELAKVVVKALQKKPADRYASAEEFRYAIDDALRRGRHFRQTEVRELMERLFHDVKARQQAILEACLTGVAEAVDDDNVRGAPSDSDSHPALSEGSESDVNVPNLRLGEEHESTTPSSAIRSPLVTQEEEGDARPAALLVPHAVRAAGNAPTAEGTPARAIAVPSPAAPSRGTLIASGAALGVAILLVGAGLLWVASRRGAPPQDVVVEQARTGPPEAAPAVRGVPDDEVPAPAAPVPDAPDAPHAPEHAAAPPPAVAGSDDVEPAKQPRRQEPAASAKSRPGRGSRSKRAERADARERRDDDEVVLKSGDDKAEGDQPGGATLTLDTVPWSEVYLGKTRLGETPLVNVPIPAGEIELLLVNPGAKIRQPYFLKAESGKSYRKKLKLD